MANRQCSFCNAPYTDEKGHDYDKCVTTLETRLSNSSQTHERIQQALDKAIGVQDRRHRLHSYCDVDITRLGRHIEQARKNLVELEAIAVESLGGLPSSPPYSMETETSKWVLRSRLDGIREAIQAFEDAAK